MELIVRSSPQLYARHLQKMQRVQELLIGRVAERLDGGEARADDPRPAAIVGAAIAYMQAARAAWLASDQSAP